MFTDLDGTLLHPHTYSSDPARPALDTLKRLGIPVVFCTSKTRPEVELWRQRLGVTDPFIVENGGAALEHLLQVLSDRVRRIEGVKATETFVYLKLVKQTYSWGVR